MTACSNCLMRLFYTDRGYCPSCGTQNPHEHQPAVAVSERPPTCPAPPVYMFQPLAENDLAGLEDLTLETAVKKHVIKVLDIHAGNKSRAARSLGVSMKTVYNKLEQWGLHPKEEDHVRG